jgi:hypothetical protein
MRPLQNETPINRVCLYPHWYFALFRAHGLDASARSQNTQSTSTQNNSEKTMIFETYLTAMQGKSSQEPIKATELLQKNQTETMLLADLEQMYQRGMINRASVTKNGQTDLVVWPTGVNKPYNIKTDYKISPPKRDEQPMPPIKKATESIKSEAIAEYVLSKGQVTKDELYKAFPVPAGRPYDYVYKLIWALVNSKTLALKKAEQAKDDVLSKGEHYDKFIEKLNKKRPKGPLINMPTADEYAVADSVDEKLGQTDPLPKVNKTAPPSFDWNVEKVTPSIDETAKTTQGISKALSWDSMGDNKPSIEDCVQIIQSHLPAQTSMRIINNEDIEIYAPVLAKPILIDIKNITQAMQTLKKLDEIAVPAF